MSDPGREPILLSPLEAMAFHQNGTLSVLNTMASAMAWVETGVEHIDVIVLATSTADHWEDVKRDFRNAMAAFGIGELPGQQAEIVRLNYLLKRARSNPAALKWFIGDVSEHCPDLKRMAGDKASPDDTGPLPEHVRKIIRDSDDYFDLSVSVSVTIDALQKAQERANSHIDAALKLIAEEYPDLVRA